ncbi:MAG: hypothetical protein IIA62_02520 [Nitrospinae bacterium]|nr:hypothetical protein [Nitrospinota bacterium]
MGYEGNKVNGVKVVNILEESAEAIEKMVNTVIKDIYSKDQIILDIQTTGDNIIIILGQKN